MAQNENMYVWKMLGDRNISGPTAPLQEWGWFTTKMLGGKKYFRILLVSKDILVLSTQP